MGGRGGRCNFIMGSETCATPVVLYCVCLCNVMVSPCALVCVCVCVCSINSSAR